MIDFDGSQIYFSDTNHYKAAVWSAFEQYRKIAAIATARRILSRAIFPKRSLNDNEAAYSEGDARRDEYAVYEQALWLLEHGQVADASGSAPVPVLIGEVDSAGVDSDGVAGLFAPEALRWLGWSGVSAIRG